MLILTQNREMVVNFDNMASLYIDTWSDDEFAEEPNCFCIRAEKASDNLICMFLGRYDTEERAKEVLKEILTAFVHIKLSEDGTSVFGSFLSLPADSIFEMPLK